MDVARFKKVFDTLDEEGQKNVIAQLTDEELNAVNNFKPQETKFRASDMIDTPARNLRQAVSNVPESAGRLISGIAQAVTHPVESFQGLRSAFRGGIRNVLGDVVLPDPEMNRDLSTASAVGKHYTDRLGGLENIRNTLITDPVGFATDLAGITALTGTALRTAGATRAADVASSVSRAVDPIAGTAKAVTAVASPVYKYAAGMTSGMGAKAVGDALSEAPGFVPAMRGKVTGGEVVEQTKDALQGIREARGTQYRSRLEGLKNAKQEIPIDDIKNLADEQLKRFNVKVADEGLDFSRSTASGASAKEIEEVYKLVKDWGSKPGDLTPAMLDVLKRRLDDFYAEGRTSRAMVTTLKKAVQDKIVRAVPEYAEMTADYAKTSSLIQEIEKALSVGKRSSADTALRKLMVAAREDKNFRRDLIKILDDSGATNIEGTISGVSANPIWSNRLGQYATAATGAGLATVSPALAGVIALASPRLVGEASVLFGRLGRAAKKARGTGLLAYQAGAVPLGPE